MLNKLKKKLILLVGSMVASVLGLYVGAHFSKYENPLIDIKKASADIPPAVDDSSLGGTGGGNDSSGASDSSAGGADCCGY